MGVTPVLDGATASWIWCATPERPALFASAGPSSTVAFRRSFRVVHRRPLDHLLATADSRYRLYIDGRQLGVGPIRSTPSCVYLDPYELDQLDEGEHVLSAVVRHYGRDTPWSLQAPRVGTLGMGGLLVLGGELSSDAAWRCRTIGFDTGDPVGVHGCPVEHRQVLPADWQLPGFDDRDWPAVQPLDATGGPLPSRGRLPSAPFTMLRVRTIPALTADAVEPTGAAWLGTFELDRSVLPPTIARWNVAGGGRVGEVTLPVEVGVGQQVTIDVGRIVVGVPELTVSAAMSCTITVVVGELLDDRGVAEIRPRLQLTRLDLAGDGQPAVVAPFDASGFRFVTVIATAAITIAAVMVREERCPTDTTSRFASDDAELDRLWRSSVRTRELCATDAYVDCPTREDRAWLGDLYVHAMVGFVVDRDQRMTRRALMLGAGQQRDDGLLPVVAGGDFARFGDVIPDYSLHWIRAVRQYWIHTGDELAVKALVPRIGPIIDWFHHFVEGDTLGAVPGWVFLDANPIPDGPLGPLQVLFAMALADAAALYAVAGERRRSAAARVAGQRMLRGVAALWSPSAGAFLDAPGTEKIVTERMQALAILSGAADAAQRRAMLDTLHRMPRWVTPGAPPSPHGEPAAFPSLPEYSELTGLCVQTSPFFAHFLHQAYAATGRHDLLLTSLRRWSAFGAGGYDTIGEHWDPIGWLSSRCHAWSATPAYDLSTHIAGVRPLRPGYGHVLVAPRLAGLRRIEARVPTPYGDVSVDLARRGRALVGEVHLPEGMTGVFRAGSGSRQRELVAGTNHIS